MSQTVGHGDIGRIIYINENAQEFRHADGRKWCRSRAAEDQPWSAWKKISEGAR